ncbi:hypothetical protein D3C80_1459230 [compost metagenome]
MISVPPQSSHQPSPSRMFGKVFSRRPRPPPRLFRSRIGMPSSTYSVWQTLLRSRNIPTSDVQADSGPGVGTAPDADIRITPASGRGPRRPFPRPQPRSRRSFCPHRTVSLAQQRACLSLRGPLESSALGDRLTQPGAVSRDRYVHPPAQIRTSQTESREVRVARPVQPLADREADPWF